MILRIDIILRFWNFMEQYPEELHGSQSEPEEGEDIFDAEDDDEENLMEDN